MERSLWITHLLRIFSFSVLLAKDGAFFRRGGKHEHMFDEHFDCGGARLKDWKEAKSLFKAFGVLASSKVRFP